MRWKRLLALGLVSAALVVPGGNAFADSAGARFSPSPVEVVGWLETIWRRIVIFESDEAPLDEAAAEDGGPEWDPDGPAVSEPEGGAASAEGGPEWDPNGNS